MKAEVAPRLPYNGAMLRWAREWRGRSIKDAADRIGVDPQRLRNWEAQVSEDIPTVRQARRLAEYYERAFIEFFYDEPPTIYESSLVPDYRSHRGSDPQGNRELLAIQHWAELQRVNALDLIEELGDVPPAFPDDLAATLDEDVEYAAVRAREVMGLKLSQQLTYTYKERQQLASILREKMEQVGVLVLRENALTNYGVSGMTIVQFPLPIIVFASEAPARSVFTLMHEFAHIVLRESAISGGDRARDTRTHDRQVEKWCDRFAAAFLVPKVELEQMRPRPTRPYSQIDDITLAAIAKHFRVSQHAMLIRLVDLQHVSPDYYWNVKRPQFLAEEANWKRRGRTKVWASRVWNQLGGLYTNLVLEALGTGKIQSHQAQTLFGVANPIHLDAIKQEFGAG